MTEHLPPEMIERLENYQLKGESLLAALAHVEECEECRLETKSPSKEEIGEQLFRDERKELKSLSEESKIRSTRRTDGKTGWRERLRKFLRGTDDFKNQKI